MSLVNGVHGSFVHESSPHAGSPPIFSLLPFDVGSLCLARLSHDEWKLAEIVEKRPAQSQQLQQRQHQDGDDEGKMMQINDAPSWDFYIHFKDLNRRLDRWVTEDELRPAPAPEPPFIVYSPAIAQQPHVASPVLQRSSLILSSPAHLRRGVAATVLPPFSPLHSPLPFHPAFSHFSFPVPSPATSALPSDSSPTPAERRLTRRERRLTSRTSDDPQLTYTDEGEVEIEREHAEKTKVRNIQAVVIATPASSAPAGSADGGLQLALASSYRLACWYHSPYPPPYRTASGLCLCGFCFAYFVSQDALTAHWLDQCSLHHPPGNEIYRAPGEGGEGGVSVWEVDGERHRLFCQNLCLLSKLFIDHKTAVYDTEPFLFYLLTVHQRNGHTLVAYFSREKHSVESNNVACILAFPQHQRRGYGRFLIALSYQLSIIEGRAGGPERPLSDLGRASYRSYWNERLLDLLSGYGEGAVCGVEELSVASGMKREDIVRVLREHGLVRYVKGEHVVTVDAKKVEEWRERSQAEKAKAAQAKEGGSRQRRCDFDPRLLQWKPPAFPKSTATAATRERRRGPGRKSSDDSPEPIKRKRDEHSD